MSVKKIIIIGSIAGFVLGSILCGGPFGFIDFLVVRPIVNIFYLIYSVIGDFGLSIILFTVLVKLCMWPLMRKQLYQTKQMKKLQPELVRIRKECNGNKQMESLQTMDLYKKYNVKPFRSFVSIFIQLPIFIALFSAVKVVATPVPQDNISNRAYGFVLELNNIKEVAELQRNYLSDIEHNTYDFHPQLFNVIDLDVTAGFNSISAIFVLFCALAASFLQYLSTKQQQPSNNGKKKKKFRDLLKEASEGKEPDQTEIANSMSGQMSIMMPLMLLFVTLNLHGALVFYYFLSSLTTFIQQKIIFNNANDAMDEIADKAIVKELNKIQEAEIITNKKTGTKITHISAKNNKKRRK